MNQSWPEYGIGFFVTEEKNYEATVEALLKALHINTADLSDDPMYFQSEAIEVIQETLDHQGITCREYIYGEIEGISVHAVSGESEEPERVLTVWAKRQMDPFKAAYANEQELIQEFKDLFGAYMPDDFKWEDHVGEFSCSICC